MRQSCLKSSCNSPRQRSWTPRLTCGGTEADLWAPAQFVTSTDLDTQTTVGDRGWPWGYTPQFVYTPIRHIHRYGHPRLNCGGQRLTLGLLPNSSLPQIWIPSLNCGGTDLDTQTKLWWTEAGLRATAQFVTSTNLDTLSKLLWTESDLRATAQFV
jgi:hypothetical protein